MYKKNKLKNLILPVFIAFIALVLFVFNSAVNNLGKGSDAEGKRQLESAIRKAAVNCYAVEGSYPQDIAYLEQHYGIQINREKYAVFYNIFASNLMPEIDIVEIGQ